MGRVWCTLGVPEVPLVCLLMGFFSVLIRSPGGIISSPQGVKGWMKANFFWPTRISVSQNLPESDFIRLNLGILK